MGNPVFEDVFPIGNGGFSIAMLVYQRVNHTTKKSQTDKKQPNSFGGAAIFLSQDFPQCWVDFSAS